MDLAAELQRIYDSEIKVRIGWTWNGGVEVRVGDEAKGFVAQETFAEMDGIGPWLQQAIAHFYPDCAYARTLDSEVRQLAAQRIFQAPNILIGASVRTAAR
jgi:hypothetical protein